MIVALAIAGAHGCGAERRAGRSAGEVDSNGASTPKLVGVPGVADASDGGAGPEATARTEEASAIASADRASARSEEASAIASANPTNTRPGGAVNRDTKQTGSIHDAPVVEPDARLVDSHPSLAYYPGSSARLYAALAGTHVREILVALSESLAPYRWPDAYDWDRHGFIDLAGARPGFVTRVSGVLVPQDGERHDLGCAGGFLEGVRLAWLPRLAVEDLDRCEPPGPVTGGPEACDPEHAYGWLALANIARRLRPAQLPEGPHLFEFGPHDPGAVERLAASDAMHLCTVSHLSATREKARFYHHMMIVAGGGDSVDIFDTTGARGVAYTTLPLPRFRRYCTTLLAASEEFRYVSRSTRLTCVRVAG